MLNCSTQDAEGFLWHFTVTVKSEADRVTIRTLIAARIDYDGELEGDRA